MCFSPSPLFGRKKVTSFSNIVLPVKLVNWLLCVVSAWLTATILKCMTSLLREPFGRVWSVNIDVIMSRSHTFVAGFASMIVFFSFLFFFSNEKTPKNLKQRRIFHCWLLRCTKDSANIYDCYGIFSQETGLCCFKAFYV